MITARVKKHIKLAWDWMIFFRCSPYEWDKKKQRVLITKSRARLRLWYFNAGSYALYVAYISVRGFQFFFKENEDYKYWFFARVSFIWGLFHVFIATLQFNLLFCFREMPEFIEAYFEYFAEFEDLYEQKGVAPKTLGGKVKADVVGYFLQFCYQSCQGLLATFIVCPLVVPSLPFYLSSLYDEPHPVLVAALFLPIGYLCFSTFSLMFFYAFCGLPYIFYLLQVLSQMTLNSHLYTSHSALRRESHLVQNYQLMRLLHIQLEINFLRIVAPAMKWVFMLVCSWNIYMAVTVGGMLALIGAIISVLILVFLGVVMTYAGKVFENSKRMLESWDSPERSPAFRAHLQSLQPLKIRLGIFYFADKGLPLSMFGFIFETACDLLMAT